LAAGESVGSIHDLYLVHEIGVQAVEDRTLDDGVRRPESAIIRFIEFDLLSGGEQDVATGCGGQEVLEKPGHVDRLSPCRIGRIGEIDLLEKVNILVAVLLPAPFQVAKGQGVGFEKDGPRFAVNSGICVVPDQWQGRDHLRLGRIVNPGDENGPIA
jgi:hypothetical protein